MNIVTLMRFLLKRSLFCARALERHRLLVRSPLLCVRRFMRSQNNEFWIILVFGKTSRILPADGKSYCVCFK